MAETAKSRTKSRKPGTFVPGDPRIQRGKGPAKGAPNAGRPKDEDKEFILRLLASPECQDSLERILKFAAMKDMHLWLKAWTLAWDKVKSKPPIQVEGGDERKPLTIRLIRE